MRKLFALSSILLLMSFFFAYIPDQAGSQGTRSTYMTLKDAVDYGYVDADISGAYSGWETSFDLDNGDGVFYGKCIDLSLSSDHYEDLQLDIPAGRKLICNDLGTQDMVVTSYESIYLDSYGYAYETLDAMCMEMHESAPFSDITYDIGYSVTGDLMDVVDEIDFDGAQNSAGQCAIWAVTDAATEEDLKLYGASDGTIEAADKILDDSGVSQRIKESEGGAVGSDYTFADPCCGSLFAIPVLTASILVIFVKRRKKNLRK